MTVFRQRRNALLSRVARDGYLVVDLARLVPKEIDHSSLFYLTGYRGEGVLLVTRAETVLLADERYFEVARSEIGHDLSVRPATGDYLANIAEEVERLGLSEFSFTSNRITYSLYDRLKGLLGIDLIPREDPISGLRMLKDDEEIRCIDAAVDVSESCLHQLIEGVEIGMTEKAIASRLNILMLEAGAEPAFETIVAAGENSFNQHHQPSDRRIKAEDLLLIDFGATTGEYLADISRTFAVGAITTEMQAIHDAARRATEFGVESLRPGASIHDVWQAIRDYFDTTDFASHSAISGHCFGLDVHERPFILEGDPSKLQPGMTTTMEPGIYIQGYGGVRIEDDVLITPDGPRCLTSFPRELMVVG
jgi:Xaa-Pro aminopeptidase